MTQGSYHDGMWAGGSGPEQEVQGPMTVHWDRSVHSIVVEVGEKAVGIRAAKASASLQEMLLAAASIPAVEALAP